MKFTVDFVRLFLLGIYLLMPILFFLAVVIVAIGQIVGKIEKWNAFDALYWSFITAMTVGYGDIIPSKRLSKVFSVTIGILGLMLTGIIVAITVHTATKALEKHRDPTVLEKFIGKVK